MSIYGDDIFFNEEIAFNNLLESCNIESINENGNERFKKIVEKFKQLLKWITDKIKSFFNMIKGKIFKSKVKADAEAAIQKETKNKDIPLLEVKIKVNFGNYNHITKLLNEVTAMQENIGLPFGNEDPDSIKEHKGKLDTMIERLNTIKSELIEGIKDENIFTSSSEETVTQNEIDGKIDEAVRFINKYLESIEKNISSSNMKRMMADHFNIFKDSTDPNNIFYNANMEKIAEIKCYTLSIECYNIISTNIFRYSIDGTMHNFLKANSNA